MTSTSTTSIRRWRIVHSESSRGWGGQEIRVFTELKAMRSRGHAVALIAHRKSRIYVAAKAVGIEVIKLNDRKWAYPTTLLQLACWLKKWKADVVNTHSSRDGWLVGLAARLADVKILIRSRHIEVDYPNRFLSRIAFGSLPDLVMTTSEKISRRLITELGLEPCRVECIPTGIDLDRFHPEIPRTLRDDLHVEPHIRLVGIVSVLRSWKGHDVFLDAIEKLKSRHPKTRYWIVGGGPGYQRLSDEIKKRNLEWEISLLGHRDDVPEILSALDILVLPSTAHEGIPQIILQAQAMGKAAIGTTIGGIPEVIEDRITGLLVPPKDPTALANALDELLTSTETCQTLGANAHKKAIASYSLKILCDRIEQAYSRTEALVRKEIR